MPLYVVSLYKIPYNIPNFNNTFYFEHKVMIQKDKITKTIYFC